MNRIESQFYINLVMLNFNLFFFVIAINKLYRSSKSQRFREIFLINEHKINFFCGISNFRIVIIRIFLAPISIFRWIILDVPDFRQIAHNSNEFLVFQYWNAKWTFFRSSELNKRLVLQSLLRSTDFSWRNWNWSIKYSGTHDSVRIS